MTKITLNREQLAEVLAEAQRQWMTENLEGWVTTPLWKDMTDLQRSLYYRLADEVVKVILGLPT